MGGSDKGLLDYQGRPLIERILDQVPDSLNSMSRLISANRNLQLYSAYAPVVADNLQGYQGPLAGVQAALQTIKTDWMLSLPCDAPRIPQGYFGKMLAYSGSTGAVAVEGEQMQPVYALIHSSLQESLSNWLSQDKRKTREWYAAHSFTEIRFAQELSGFRNINTPDDLVINKPSEHD